MAPWKRWIRAPGSVSGTDFAAIRQLGTGRRQGRGATPSEERQAGNAGRRDLGSSCRSVPLDGTDRVGPADAGDRRPVAVFEREPGIDATNAIDESDAVDAIVVTGTRSPHTGHLDVGVDTIVIGQGFVALIGAAVLRRPPFNVDTGHGADGTEGV